MHILVIRLQNMGNRRGGGGGDILQNAGIFGCGPTKIEDFYLRCCGLFIKFSFNSVLPGPLNWVFGHIRRTKKSGHNKINSANTCKSKGGIAFFLGLTFFLSQYSRANSIVDAVFNQHA